MRTRIGAGFLWLVLAGFGLEPFLMAQDVGGYGGELDERASARVLYWDQKLDGPVGQFAIDYVRPEWKSDYEDPATFDGMTKGKVWRMGNNFWTTLDTSLPLKISEKVVPPGYYYLGLRRSADGHQWTLAFIDPVKARTALLDGSVIDQAKVEFEAPVPVVKAAEKAAKLLITLHHDKFTPTDVKFRLAWGNLQVFAPIDVSLAK